MLTCVNWTCQSRVRVQFKCSVGYAADVFWCVRAIWSRIYHQYHKRSRHYIHHFTLLLFSLTSFLRWEICISGILMLSSRSGEILRKSSLDWLTSLSDRDVRYGDCGGLDWARIIEDGFWVELGLDRPSALHWSADSTAWFKSVCIVLATLERERHKYMRLHQQILVLLYKTSMLEKEEDVTLISQPEARTVCAHIICVD